MWYGRYIDDLFFIFSGSEQQLIAFHNYLNTTNPNIELSLEYSSTEIHFLDLNITVDQQGKLHSSIYRKSTDRNTILRADSFHPKSLISNIPYGQFKRLRRICDNDTDFELQAKDMYHRFEQRGYNKTVLNKALTRTTSLNRRQLLQKTPHEPQPSQVRFSTQYSNMAYDI